MSNWTNGNAQQLTTFGSPYHQRSYDTPSRPSPYQPRIWRQSLPSVATPPNIYKPQLSKKEYMDYEPVLKRIKKAHDFVEQNQDKPSVLIMATDRFETSVIPEAVAVGISETFAWGLYFFGKEFLKTEMAYQEARP